MSLLVGMDVRTLVMTHGGITYSVLGWLRALLRLGGAEYRLFTHARTHERWDAPAREVVLRWPLRAPWMECAWERWWLPRAAEAAGCRVFHGPRFMVPPSRRMRLVATIYDLAFRRFPGVLPPESARYFDDRVRDAVARADRLHAVSAQTRDDLISLYGADADRIIVIPAGVAPEFFDGAARAAEARTRWHVPERFMLAVSTVEPRKNYVRLVRAFARSGLASADVALVIAGRLDSDTGPVRRAASEAGVDGAVRLLGEVPREALPPLYAAAAAFVLPSLYEGWCLSLAEALAAGLPVLTSDRGSHREVAGDAALFVDPEDEAALADGLRRIVEDERLRVTLSGRAAARARACTWEEAAGRLLALYRGLA